MSSRPAPEKGKTVSRSAHGGDTAATAIVHNGITLTHAAGHVISVDADYAIWDETASAFLQQNDVNLKRG